MDDLWFAGIETVLVTAGASASDLVVQECVRHLEARFGATVETRTIRNEHVSYPLPKELREMVSDASNLHDTNQR